MSEKNLIDALRSLQDGQSDELGALLGRAARAVSRLEIQNKKLSSALAGLVEAHDEAPSMLTTAEWEMARQALGKQRGEKALVVVITMDAHNIQWLAVGYTVAQAKAGLKKQWDVRSAMSWDLFTQQKGSDPMDYFGAWVWETRPGKAYIDGFDEKSEARS